MAQLGGVPAGSRARLRPTLTQTRAAVYRRPGGPWDRGPLDASFPAGARADVVDDSGRLDAAAAYQAVGEVAGALVTSGVRRGDVVSWQLPNSAAALLLYRACWRIGAVAAPLHHRMGSRCEVAGALDQVRPRARHRRGGHRRPPIWPGAPWCPPGTCRRAVGRPGPRGRAIPVGRRGHRCSPPTSPWPCSPRGRPACPRRRCTPTAAWPTRRRSWWGSTDCTPRTLCSCRRRWRTCRDCSTGC